MIGAPALPVAEPAKGDKRFKDAGWHEYFLFDYVKQSYLITARWLHEQVASVEGLSDPAKKKVHFFTRQYIDALAPSNFALTNPEVFRETVASGGQNLVRGLNNLLDDIERGNEVALLDVVEQEVLVPVLVLEALVALRGFRDRARGAAHHPQHRRLPQVHVVVPQP